MYCELFLVAVFTGAHTSYESKRQHRKQPMYIVTGRAIFCLCSLPECSEQFRGDAQYKLLRAFVGHWVISQKKEGPERLGPKCRHGADMEESGEPYTIYVRTFK